MRPRYTLIQVDNNPHTLREHGSFKDQLCKQVRTEEYKMPNLQCRNVSRVPSSRAEADLLHIWRLGRAIIGLRLEAAAAVI